MNQKHKLNIKFSIGPSPRPAMTSKMKPPINAISKLLNGPATDVSIPANRGFLKLKRLTGTGRAQPNPNKSKKIVPSGSR